MGAINVPLDGSAPANALPDAMNQVPSALSWHMLIALGHIRVVRPRAAIPHLAVPILNRADPLCISQMLAQMLTSMGVAVPSPQSNPSAPMQQGMSALEMLQGSSTL